MNLCYPDGCLGRLAVQRTLHPVISSTEPFLRCGARSATDHLIAYLNDRLVHGEPLHGDSPVVAPDYIYKTGRGRNSTKTFLPTQRISRTVRQVFRPRFSWRPYVLRAYFDTQLLIAESKEGLHTTFASSSWDARVPWSQGTRQTRECCPRP